MELKKYLLATAFRITEDEQAIEEDIKLAKRVCAELKAQHTKESDLVFVLYEAASSCGYLMDRIKLFKKGHIMNLPSNPHLDLIAEEWDLQAKEAACKFAEGDPDCLREHLYQCLRFDPEIGLNHLINSQYTEQLCAALSSVAVGMIRPVSWRNNKESCLSCMVYDCQPRERIYRLLTRHMKTQPQWNSGSVNSEMVTRNPFCPSCAPIYDERKQYLSQYPSLVNLYSNLQLYRRLKDIQKVIDKETVDQTSAALQIDMNLIHDQALFDDFDSMAIWTELQSDDGDLPT